MSVAFSGGSVIECRRKAVFIVNPEMSAAVFGRLKSNVVGLFGLGQFVRHSRPPIPCRKLRRPARAAYRVNHYRLRRQRRVWQPGQFYLALRRLCDSFKTSRVWYNRLAIFGSYNFGTTPGSPRTIALTGFAVAF